MSAAEDIQRLILRDRMADLQVKEEPYRRLWVPKDTYDMIHMDKDIPFLLNKYSHQHYYITRLRRYPGKESLYNSRTECHIAGKVQDNSYILLDIRDIAPVGF